ncbi:MAG: hypothetical protein H0W72_05710 [Planctomycetes bacterium]|nr:hypothetical protein [Planctomycetota bacterium]
MRHLLLPLALSFICVTASAADPTSPEEAILAPIKALRSNDLLALFKSLPAADQAEAEQSWKEEGAKASPTQKAEFDQKLAILLNDDAIEQLAAQVEPMLQSYNPQEAAGQLMMVGGMIAMGMAQDEKSAEIGKTLQALIMDMSTWLPKAGFEDPAKLRAALTKVVAAAKALKVTTADQFFALSISDLLTRAGAAVKEIKAAFTVYELNPDAFLDSLIITKVEGSGDQRTASLQFTAFGRNHTIPVNLEQKDGKWVFKQDALEGLMPGAGAQPVTPEGL